MILDLEERRAVKRTTGVQTLTWAHGKVLRRKSLPMRSSRKQSTLETMWRTMIDLLRPNWNFFSYCTVLHLLDTQTLLITLRTP